MFFNEGVPPGVRVFFTLLLVALNVAYLCCPCESVFFVSSCSLFCSVLFSSVLSCVPTTS